MQFKASIYNNNKDNKDKDEIFKTTLLTTLHP